MSSTGTSSGEWRRLTPHSPYRGVFSFRYADREFYFGREEQIHELAARLLVARVVVLFGEPGAGKSSLINAGVIPFLLKEGFRPERLRCRPEAEAPLAVERIEAPDQPDGYLPSLFLVPDAATPEEAGETVSCTPAKLLARLRGCRSEQRPVLIFDQFEEVFTRFRGQPTLQREVLDALFQLMTDTALPVKILIGIREDFLAHLEVLAKPYPKVFDHRVRLAHLEKSDAERAVTGPFLERAGGPLRFQSRITAEAASAIADDLASGQPNERVHATELQIVCYTLWREFSAAEAEIKPDHYRKLGGKQEIIAGFLGGQLRRLPERQRALAEAVLKQLITEDGTRDRVSESKLRDVLEAREGRRRVLLDDTLRRLDQSRILVCTTERGTSYCEIASEYLIPAVRRAEQERGKADLEAAWSEARGLKKQRMWILALLLVAAIFVAFHQWRASRTNEALATLLQHIDAATVTDPELAALLALQAVRLEANDETLAALQRAQAANRLLRTLTGHKEQVVAVAYSPNADLIASGGNDGTAWIWDARSGKKLRELPDRGQKAHQHGTHRVVFAPGGAVLATGGWDGLVRLWSPYSGALRAEWTAHTKWLDGIAFHPDGTLIATTGGDEASGTPAGGSGPRVCLWDARRGARLRCARLAGKGANEVAFDASGKTIGLAGRDGVVRLLHTETLAEFRTYPTVPDELLTVAFRPGGEMLAAAGLDARIRVYGTGLRPLQTISGHSNTVFQTSFDRAGRLASASADGNVKVWDPETGRELFRLPGHALPIASLAFSPDGERLVTGSWDKTLKIWQAASHQDRLHGVVFHPSRSEVFAASRDGTVKVWDPSSRTVLRTLVAMEGEISGLALSEDGRFVAVATEASELAVHDPVSGALIKRLNPGDRASNLRFSPDSRWLAAQLEGGLMAFWGTDGWRQRPEVKAHELAFTLAWAAGGKQLITGSHDGTVKLWNAATGSAEVTLYKGTALVFCLAVNREGTLLAVGDIEGMVRLWDLASRKLIRTLSAHTAAVTDVELSSNGEWLATAGWDHTAHVWEVKTGRRRMTLRHAGQLEGLAFSRDGQLLVTASEDSTRPNVFYLDRQELIRAARRSLRPSLTQQECQRYLDRSSCPSDQD